MTNIDEQKARKEKERKGEEEKVRGKERTSSSSKHFAAFTDQKRRW